MSKFETIKIKFHENLYEIDTFWLRDHCRCVHCYNIETFQRKTNILDIPDDINASDFIIKNGKLQVFWNDGHESSYDLDFILKNLNPQSDKYKRVYWTKETFKVLEKVEMSDFLTNSDTKLAVLKNLYLYGFAFIDGVEPTEEGTKQCIENLFQIQKTFFGEMWTFSDANLDHCDTAYTNYYLPGHNDNTYFNDPAGLQILHCVQDNCTGGENFLIDGYQVATKIKKNYPEIYKRLTTTLVPAEFIENDRHHSYCAPIFQLHPLTKEILQIRFNDSDRAPFNTLKQTEVRQFYKDLKFLANEFNHDENQIVFKLKPGRVMIFDNWRVLHGRYSYDGCRTMSGSYVSRTEFQSVLRVNGLIN
ncbi:hypothetical protein PVAND_009547 [Polypedilum vanderplanki]|uniref:Trimethyllysine dioxygenase, mitochondrial n=1 Tax=Polypedilum vanderplanki TaxID=319348 RepID=A0A9J6CEG3_POLVA|nr:hypothetical protein PVAND_009547 [Polypedilum vanderplanki]